MNRNSSSPGDTPSATHESEEPMEGEGGGGGDTEGLIEHSSCDDAPVPVAQLDAILYDEEMAEKQGGRRGIELDGEGDDYPRPEPYDTSLCGDNAGRSAEKKVVASGKERGIQLSDESDDGPAPPNAFFDEEDVKKKASAGTSPPATNEQPVPQVPQRSANSLQRLFQRSTRPRPVSQSVPASGSSVNAASESDNTRNVPSPRSLNDEPSTAPSLPILEATLVEEGEPTPVIDAVAVAIETNNAEDELRQQKQKRKQRILVTGLLLIIVALVAVIAITFANRSTNSLDGADKLDSESNMNATLPDGTPGNNNGGPDVGGEPTLPVSGESDGLSMESSETLPDVTSPSDSSGSSENVAVGGLDGVAGAGASASGGLVPSTSPPSEPPAKVIGSEPPLSEALASAMTPIGTSPEEESLNQSTSQSISDTSAIFQDAVDSIDTSLNEPADESTNQNYGEEPSSAGPPNQPPAQAIGLPSCLPRDCVCDDIVNGFIQIPGTNCKDYVQCVNGCIAAQFSCPEDSIISNLIFDAELNYCNYEGDAVCGPDPPCPTNDLKAMLDGLKTEADNSRGKRKHRLT